MRWICIVLLGFLIGCGGDDETAQQEAAELRQEIEVLRKEKAEKEAREAALKDQLEEEAAQKVELLKELERVKPVADRVEEAERRVLEMEEMHKEVKKLE